ncbi:hypothetical protein SAMN02745150_01470 [Brevinema andersonii]|uniref:Uncharacterized protein n=1 Tax=Brevinema andersonii TaxID=34097 RepID=A0A1I1FEB4_BREAD|nr:hypothetical protein [Brevinema andersonii]SFB97302.1 hypothetical protein SAMN02745150_01470 [Brevinema andersonii]
MKLLKQELKIAKIPRLTIHQFAIKLGEYNSIVAIKAQESFSEGNLKNDYHSLQASSA